MIKKLFQNESGIFFNQVSIEIRVKKKPHYYNEASCLVAESIELSNLKVFIRDFLKVVEFHYSIS